MYRGLKVIILLLCLTGCPNASSSTPPEETPKTVQPFINSSTAYVGDPVQKVSFEGNETTKQISIDALAGHSVFIVKINTSDAAIPYNDTGYAYPSQRTPRFQNIANTNPGASSRFGSFGDTIPLYDHPAAQEFNRNPPPFFPTEQNSARSVQTEDLAPVLPVKGDTKKFWVQDKNNAWQQIDAVLRETSTHCNVWIGTENFTTETNNFNDNKLTQVQAQKIAEKFDQIYEYETALFGYEYGGGVPLSDPTYGGVDKDPKIQILVYDINYDAGVSKDVTLLGYFWGKDYYSQSFLDSNGYSYKTNLAEIFYIDSFVTDGTPDLTYSTLVHEFQHMINFNEKNIKSDFRLSPAVWYNEMLSMLAEDMISPFIGVGYTHQSHPIQQRIPAFLGDYYFKGVTEWDTKHPLVSYANNYAFGAYLARNYGGPELVKKIARNNMIDTDSISAALSELKGINFKQALNRYGEAFIYSGAHKPAGTVSFDNTVSNTASTVKGFDIWNQHNIYANTKDIPENYQGPLIWTLDYLFTMPGNSLIVQSLDEWQNITGQIPMIVSKPKNSFVDIYIMIR
jgi:hypothetical protein